MLIGDVAAATGVSTKTLRFYEREALLPEPDRLPNGYRDYEPPPSGVLRSSDTHKASGSLSRRSATSSPSAMAGRDRASTSTRSSTSA